jgi:hypothetical protein
MSSKTLVMLSQIPQIVDFYSRCGFFIYMSPAEIAAYIGAAAWIPQIARWLYRSYVTPQIEIVSGRYASVGYTRFGPIFNLNLGFSAARKSALIESLDLVLVHEQGERHVFQMEGMSETMSDIADASGGRATVSKEQITLAFRIPTETLLERFVRFQEGKFNAALEPLIQNAATAVQHERQMGGDYFSRLSGMKEVRELITFNDGYFWWKAGRYTIFFGMRSPERIRLKAQKFEVTLTQMDVDALRSNLAQFNPEYENIVRAGEEGYSFKPVNWNWRSTRVKRL